MENKHKCYLCEKLCYCGSTTYDKCVYRTKNSFNVSSNREYETICTKLAEKFANRHGWKFEGWVGYFNPEKDKWNQHAGTCAMVNGEVFDLEDMRTDIMMDAHPDAICTYMDEAMEEIQDAEREGREPRRVSYYNWLRGARHNPSMESMEYKDMLTQQLQEELVRLEQERDELMKQLQEKYQKDADSLLENSEGLF